MALKGVKPMLKLMTLNCNYDKDYLGNWPSRKRLIIDTIKSSEPDIASLQAVCIDNGLDQAYEIGTSCAFSYLWFQSASINGKRKEGSAILSKIPIRKNNFKNLTLIPGLKDETKRILMYSQFDFSQGHLFLFNAHFSWVEQQNHLNVMETIPFIENLKGPALLTGDLNAPDFTSMLDPLKKNGWTDVWEQLNPGQKSPTFPSDNPNIRIDYFWANKQILPKLKKIRIVANKPDEKGTFASNHYGLMLTLELDRKGVED